VEWPRDARPVRVALGPAARAHLSSLGTARCPYVDPRTAVSIAENPEVATNIHFPHRPAWHGTRSARYVVGPTREYRASEGWIVLHTPLSGAVESAPRPCLMCGHRLTGRRMQACSPRCRVRVYCRQKNEALLTELRESPSDLARLIERLPQQRACAMVVAHEAVAAWEVRAPEAWRRTSAWLAVARSRSS
jgi:hypothetical protein